MELTDTQRAVLERIGRQGATRAKLGNLADSVELHELIASGYVTYEPIVLAETQGSLAAARQAPTRPTSGT
jgi:hypothetical protein